MARLWSDGFEHGDSVFGAYTGNRGDYHVVLGSPTASTTTKRSGAYALRINGLVSGARLGLEQRFLGSVVDSCYSRFYLYVSTFPSAKNTIFTIAGNTLSLRSGIMLENNGALTAIGNIGTTEHTSAAGVITSGAWHRVEFYQNVTTNQLIVRVDGVDVLDFSDYDVTLGTQFAMIGGNLQQEAQTTGEWFFDDVALNDTTGTTQNSWCGEGSIVHVHPNAAGDFSEGTLTGAATRWEAVGDVAPDTTTYVLMVANGSSWGVADRLMVGCESAASRGIGASDAITFVAVGAMVNNLSASGSQFVVAVESQASGTRADGAARTFLSSTDRYVVNGYQDSNRNYTLYSYTDPQSGGAWTPALIDSMQIGIRGPDANPDFRVTKLWALVEFVASAPTTKARPLFRQSTRFVRRSF
jgi:hypothetical protein